MAEPLMLQSSASSPLKSIEYLKMKLVVSSVLSLNILALTRTCLQNQPPVSSSHSRKLATEEVGLPKKGGKRQTETREASFRTTINSMSSVNTVTLHVE